MSPDQYGPRVRIDGGRLVEQTSAFHIEIRIVDGEPGMRLVDGPFESVPQGGPDLTRAQALEHEDLPYVWFVADNVMAQDRRAAWMEHWLRGTRAFVTARVAEDLGAVRRVVRDQEGDWQLFDALEGDPGESRVTHLSHLIDADQSLLDVLDLGVGEEATRMSRDAAWVREVRG